MLPCPQCGLQCEMPGLTELLCIGQIFISGFLVEPVPMCSSEIAWCQPVSKDQPCLRRPLLGCEWCAHTYFLQDVDNSTFGAFIDVNHTKWTGIGFLCLQRTVLWHHFLQLPQDFCPSSPLSTVRGIENKKLRNKASIWLLHVCIILVWWHDVLYSHFGSQTTHLKHCLQMNGSWGI